MTGWTEKTLRIEDLGFATLLVPDGLQHTPAPFPALAAAAAVTRRLHLGTYVLANDYHHALMLAKEAATLALLSEGRFELGIGAGRPAAAADLAMLGRAFDPAPARIERLASTISLLKRLLAGETVEGSSISPLPAHRPLLLVAGSQPRMLRLAGREADVVALGVGPGTDEAALEECVRWVREGAGDRDLDLNLSPMAVAGHVPRYLQLTLGDDGARALAQSDAVPVLKGGVAQMCDRLEYLRERFGISYLCVGEELMDAITPVVERLAGR